jgi:hypothetical protein
LILKDIKSVLYKNISLVTQIAKARHAPFISHPKEFLKAVFEAFQK